MASALRSSLVKCVSKSLRSTTSATTNVCGKLASPLQTASRGLTLNRYLASISSCRHGFRKLEKISAKHTACQRCCFHTEGIYGLNQQKNDKQFSLFRVEICFRDSPLRRKIA